MVPPSGQELVETTANRVLSSVKDLKDTNFMCVEDEEVVENG